MWENLSKIIKLIEKTGDKCIVLNEQGEPIVIMGLNDYEKLNFQRAEVSQMTQEELLDKINREIAVWRSANQDREEQNSADLDFSKNIDDNKLNFSKDPDIYNNTGNEPAKETKKDNENDEYLVEPVD